MTPQAKTFLGPLCFAALLALLTPAPGRAIAETTCHARCADGDCWCVLCNCGCSTGVLTPNAPWCGERRPMTAHVSQGVTSLVLPFLGDAGELALSYNSVARNADHGSASSASGAGFYYTPDPGFTGQDSFTFRICNFYGQCDYGTVLVDVLP